MEVMEGCLPLFKLTAGFFNSIFECFGGCQGTAIRDRIQEQIRTKSIGGLLCDRDEGDDNDDEDDGSYYYVDSSEDEGEE